MRDSLSKLSRDMQIRESSKTILVGSFFFLIIVSGFVWYISHESRCESVIKLDQEQYNETGEILNPATQSLNRYFSSLRNLDRIRVNLSKETKRFSMEIVDDEDIDNKVHIKNIDLDYLIPLLPYDHSKIPDDFDLANLMLAEYARTGLSLSHQYSNTELPIFYSKSDIFSDDKEYLYRNGTIEPNPRIRPKRLTIINNCLKPGLWELEAVDSVGEIYHGWFDMPLLTYLEMIRLANDIDISDLQLWRALRYRRDLSNVELKLERLRKEKNLLLTAIPSLVKEKQLGSYSTQDSRRKTQQGYYRLLRNGAPLPKTTFGELRKGDVFKMRKFISPGIYSSKESTFVQYQPEWTRVEIREVEPLTRYAEGQLSFNKNGHIEISLYNDDDSKAIIAGNIPISLLVEQDDYRIPSFGVGVFSPSEFAERRYLRKKQGPAPHYAYLVDRKGDSRMLMNNHVTGYEQLYLRPFQRDGQLVLRITLASYERILDIMELEVTLDGELQRRIEKATAEYQPPLYRVYEDSNIL